jgi:uncharacterized protein (TIGR02687 family)
MDDVNIAFDSIKDGVEKYKDLYYLMDLYYRKFYLNYNRKIDSYLRYIEEDVERFYYEYSRKLDEMWDKHLSELDGNWKIDGVKSQQNLFSYYIPSNKKVAVIFSDALRYEVGVELKDKLKVLPGEISVEPILSVIPSVTSLGMAALMPNVSKNDTKNDIKLNSNTNDKNNFYVIVNGKRVSSFEDRAKLLEESGRIKVFKYRNYIKLSKEKKRKLVKDKKYILFYHNTVDEVGDNAKSEDDVFEACEKAIDELYNLVKNIRNVFNISNVIITSDHGFLYQTSDLEKLDKLEKLSIDSIAINRRFILSKENANVNYVHKFSLSYINNPDYFVYIPKGNLRFKIQGGGSKYVHGGLTPQEVIIPLINYHFIKDSEKPKNVDIELLNPKRKITNNKWKLSFFQKEPISERRLPSSFKVYIEDKDGNIISELIDITANLKDADNSKRIINSSILLKGSINPKTKAYLVIENKENKTQKKLECEIDIAFPDEF